MFAREKPLPQAVLSPNPPQTNDLIEEDGILLGSAYWNPEMLPNGHIVAIGASGSGKTQTLKAIAYALRQTYPQTQVILIDFHGDQDIEGETCFPLHMNSDWGINLLVLNLDPEGGGPNLQSIQVAALLKKTLRLGPNQEGLTLDVLGECYHRRGFSNLIVRLGHMSHPTLRMCKGSLKTALRRVARIVRSYSSSWQQPLPTAFLIEISFF
ncbi:hypothetical protein AM10699_40210 [Acaryochloris marina MBIC10699]|nr:hypothetical protein [Acaryochloris marina]BDM81154.1 hypothetical protein AM10699_40210 [Acaryochloris marina MBIC10699]